MSNIVVQPQKEKVPIFIHSCCTTSVKDDKNKWRVRWTCVRLNLNGALHLRSRHDWLGHLITSLFLVNFDFATIAMS